MTSPKLTTQTTTTTRRSITLNEDQVLNILRNWAEHTHGLKNVEFDLDCETYGIREVEIIEVNIDVIES